MQKIKIESSYITAPATEPFKASEMFKQALGADSIKEGETFEHIISPTCSIELELPGRTSSALLFTREDIGGETNQIAFHIRQLLPMFDGDILEEEGKERLRQFIKVAQKALGEPTV